jgi:hypothetical protein
MQAMIELTEEQVELVSGGDTYYDIGKAVGTFLRHLCAVFDGRN